MKTQFDKIYVLSLITNKDRQEFIKYQFNELGLDFEFIYGFDFHNFNVDFPDSYKLSNMPGNGNIKKNFSCTLAHYQAVMQAYHLGYNNVLIFEDDICLIKDVALLEKMLNNIPNNIDFINYDPRHYDEQSQDKIINNIKFNSLLNKHNNYFKINNSHKMCGAAMYALMNRKTMELYLNNQHNQFIMSDWVFGFYENATVKRYIPKYALFVDQYGYRQNFIYNDPSFYCCWSNLYFKLYKYNENDFFKPFNFNIKTRI